MQVQSLAFALLVVLGLLPLASRTKAGDPPTALTRSGPLGELLAGKRILHVAAHPDDETPFAPMLAEACRFNGATCHLVVATNADSWGCLLSMGLQDRAACTAMRRMEMAASARNLNASHEFYEWREGIYDFTDAGVQANLAGLAREAGGHAALIARLRETLDAFQPDVVLAFDPRHGTTCHPNHRAVVTLLLEAIDTLPVPRRPQVWLDSDVVPPAAPEELKSIVDGYGIVRWPGDEATPVTWYDANVALPDGRTGYDYLVDALRLNATQFPEVATGKLTPAPPPQYRRVPMLRLQDIDPAQRGLCVDRVPQYLQTLQQHSEAELIEMATGKQPASE